MKKIMMKYFMVNCNEATFLMAKKEEGELTVAERLKLAMHTSMCSLCKMFEKQTAKIASESKFIHADDALSDAMKEKIEKKLKG